MPSIPTSTKLFFCRITLPHNQTHEDLVMLSKTISNKFYSHWIDFVALVHEIGEKTKKPHYHILIICKTTKPEIAKWLKTIFGVDGNEQYSIVDKYRPETFPISLAYMYKGGKNILKFKSWNLEYLKPSEAELIEIYNLNNKFQKLSDAQKKFAYYYEMVKEQLPSWTMTLPSKEKLFTLIYRILLKDAIKQKVLFRFNIISEHARCILIHINPYLIEHYCEQAQEKEFKTI